MTTRAEALSGPRDSLPIGWRLVAAELARLLALAFVMSLALGLLLTVATIAMPALP